MGNSKLIQVVDQNEQPTIQLKGKKGNIMAGGYGKDGDVILKDHEGRKTVHLEGGNANFVLGGPKTDGDILLKDHAVETTIHLEGGKANLSAGGHGHNGDIRLKDAQGKTTIHLDAEYGNLIAGGALHDGDLILKDGYGKAKIVAEAHDASLELRPAENRAGIRLDGEMGEIKVQSPKIQSAKKVFGSGEEIPSLSELKSFIETEAQLPEMPSREEMSKGIDLVTFNMQLLQKIEELTLYILQQEARLDEIEEQV